MSSHRTVVFDESDLVEVPVVNLNLPDIEVDKCFRPKDGSPYLVFYGSAAKRYDGPCPCCGCIGTEFKKVGYTPRNRLVHDVSIGIDKIDIVLQVPRYICHDCGGSFSHIFESIYDRKQCTKRLLDKIRQDCFIRPFSDISRETGYTVTSIAEIFDAYSDELDASRPPIVAPEVLSIDEKHIVKNMRAIFVDNKTGRLLEMTADNKAATVIETIESMVDYDKNIRIVTIDMANGYRSALQTCLPNAHIIVDKFHVFQDLHRCITRTKTGIMENIKKQIVEEPDRDKAEHLREVRDLVAKNPYLFKFGRKKVSEKSSRIKVLADACVTFPELNHLRLIKEGFERIYDSPTRDEAEKMYEVWRELIPPKAKSKAATWEAKHGVKAATFQEFSSFANTMKNWHKEIFGYFDEDCQYTNAVAEGTNSLIQRLNAQGNGYGFKHLRAKALFWHTSHPGYSYRIKTTKVPIYEEDPYYACCMVSTHMFGNVSRPNQTLVGYKTESEIVELQNSARARRPLSVLSYVSQDSGYYDFADDD